MGTSTQQVERLEKGQRRWHEKWIAAAAGAFGVEISAIVASDAGTPPAAIGAGGTAAKDRAIPFAFEGSGITRMTDDLPIYGTALGAARLIEGDAIEQTMLNTGSAMTWARRPQILNGRQDVYGVFVVGSSMDPAHPEGSTVIAERNRPPKIGDSVIVYLRTNSDDDDGERARCVLIKRLVRRSSSFVELQQFNPAAIFRVDAADIIRIDRVMTLDDLLA